MTAEELKQGYEWAYHNFYSWSNIFKASFGHDNIKQQLAHLLYMGGWKKFEPFWNFMIQYGNLNSYVTRAGESIGQHKMGIKQRAKCQNMV